MNENTKQGLKVFEAALLLGVLGDGLLRETPWGLNVLLWIGALVIAMVALLARWRRRALAGEGHLLLISVLLFAAAFAWRDSSTLNFLAGLGMAPALSLMAWRSRSGQICRAGISEYALAMLVAGVDALIVGTPSLFGDVRWREIPHTKWSPHLRAMALGGVLALPLMILFTGLLMSADAAFETMISRLFFANREGLIGHVFVALAMAWITGGFLRGMLLGREATNLYGRATLASPDLGSNSVNDTIGATMPAPPKGQPFHLGIVEIGVTLVLLNILFLAFVLLQLRYFFGDAALVQGSEGLTFSEYYRRGFFELVTVAALVLPLLLSLHWLLRKENPRHEQVFRLLAGAQVFLLFIMMASAVRRMLLYQSTYGLTELRFYTTAFMAWLALVFIWFAATALRGRRQQFACGAVLAGVLIIAALHLINPDAFIVRVNVTHAQAGGSFDAHYAATLSADATPALVENLPNLKENDRRIIAERLLADRQSHETGDWRSWNWARAERSRVLLENQDALRVITAPKVSDQTIEVGQTITTPANVDHAELPTAKPKGDIRRRQSRKVLSASKHSRSRLEAIRYGSRSTRNDTKAFPIASSDCVDRC